MSVFSTQNRSRGRKFLSYYKPYRRLFLADMACAVVVSAAALALPLCAGYITKDLLGQQSPGVLSQIYLVGGLMVALVAIHTACSVFVDYQGHMMGALMESDMRAELFEHYQKLSFAFYDEHKTGQLMARITSDTFALAELYHHGPEDIIISGLKLTGTLVILCSINASLTLLICLFMPVMAAYALYFSGRMRVALRASRDRIGDINAQVEDTLSGIRVVKSFTNDAVERQKFTRQNDGFVASRREGYRSEALHSGGLIAFTHLITIVVIVFGAAAITHAALGLADLVTYLLYVGILVEPIHTLINFTRLYQEGITGFNRFMEILEIAPDIQDTPGAVDAGLVRGDITFRDVSFQYRDDHSCVLKNVSLDIRAGEYVAVVGSSGVGKTTLCSLIPRFYEVKQGSILLDGCDIRELSLRSLRGAIGVVQQDVYLFAGTVADNIRYGRLDATRQEIIEAARKANAHEFIMALPDGYDTDIGQRGVKLSGGQKQRLSIARVFLKDPPVLIFDEATSALDNESEKAIRDSLEKLADSRTTLVIAHRLSTVRKARRIIVLTENGIEEQGTHEELVSMSGAYASLYNMQFEL